MSVVRIAVDAMGGDFAPGAPVEGAIQALKADSIGQLELVLVGNRIAVDAELAKHDFDRSRLRVVHAKEHVKIAESAADAIKSHRNSSMAVAIDLHRRHEVHGVVSAGHTGVQMMLSVLGMGRIEGVRRPTIGAYIPGDTGDSFLLDVGANADCKPYHLVQFAAMGSLYVSNHKGIQNPRIGLLSIGEEKSKGNALTKQAHELFLMCPFNFVGNLEGRDIVRGKADVIVCDGYVGNILLKFAETFHYLISQKLQGIFGTEPALQKADGLSTLRKAFDYQEKGGVPLLGVNGVSIVCHGASSPRAICNAIFEAKQMVEERMVEKIQNAIETYHVGIFTRGKVRLREWRSS